jgi:hypothetical protein
MPPTPFCFVCFWDKVLLTLGWLWTRDPPVSTF